VDVPRKNQRGTTKLYQFYSNPLEEGEAPVLVAETFKLKIADFVEEILGQAETLEDVWLLQRAFGYTYANRNRRKTETKNRH